MNNERFWVCLQVHFRKPTRTKSKCVSEGVSAKPRWRHLPASRELPMQKLGWKKNREIKWTKSLFNEGIEPNDRMTAQKFNALSFINSVSAQVFLLLSSTARLISKSREKYIRTWCLPPHLISFRNCLLCSKVERTKGDQSTGKREFAFARMES